MTTQLKVALGQMRVVGGQPDTNLQKAADMIAQAAEAGCQVIVLPECLDLGWPHPSARQLAQPIPGPHSDRLSEAARRHQIYIAAGLTEQSGKDIYNAAILIAPGGQIILKHRKINELCIARDIYSVGTSLSVAHTPVATFGLNICADNFGDTLELGHALGHMGAQVLLSPSAWAVEADHDNVREPYGGMWKQSFKALATRHGMSVVAVSNVGAMDSGVWAGHPCIGCSMAVGPDGNQLVQGPYGESAEVLLEVNLPLKQL